MKYKANTIKEYFEQIPEERKPALTKLWKTIRDNIPEGFTEATKLWNAWICRTTRHLSRTDIIVIRNRLCHL